MRTVRSSRNLEQIKFHPADLCTKAESYTHHDPPDMRQDRKVKSRSRIDINRWLIYNVTHDTELFSNPDAF